MKRSVSYSIASIIGNSANSTPHVPDCSKNSTDRRCARCLPSPSAGPPSNEPASTSITTLKSTGTTTALRINSYTKKSKPGFPLLPSRSSIKGVGLPRMREVLCGDGTRRSPIIVLPSIKNISHGLQSDSVAWLKLSGPGLSKRFAESSSREPTRNKATGPAWESFVWETVTRRSGSNRPALAPFGLRRFRTRASSLFWKRAWTGSPSIRKLPRRSTGWSMPMSEVLPITARWRLAMLHQQTIEKLHELRLPGMVQALEEQLKQPEVSSLSFEERLGLLVDAEWLQRQ